MQRPSSSEEKPDAEALGDVKVFHAGTPLRDGKLVTNGAYCRKDIASKAIS